MQAQKLGLLFGIAANPAKACRTQRVQAIYRKTFSAGKSITGWYNVVCKASLDF